MRDAAKGAQTKFENYIKLDIFENPVDSTYKSGQL